MDSTTTCRCGPCVCILSKGGVSCPVIASGWHNGYKCRMSASHAVGCGFVPRPGHTKDHQKNGTKCLLARNTSISV